jgi:hypothetical protein
MPVYIGIDYYKAYSIYSVLDIGEKRERQPFEDVRAEVGSWPRFAALRSAPVKTFVSPGQSAGEEFDLAAQFFTCCGH